MEKTVSEAIKYRRSVRRFDKDIEIDDNIVKKCIENAVLAPTSSNLQLWEFYHITDKDLLKNVKGVSEETTTGIKALNKMEKFI